jgi:hypothetical protein
MMDEPLTWAIHHEDHEGDVWQMVTGHVVKMTVHE